jgi:hypothetical protein
MNRSIRLAMPLFLLGLAACAPATTSQNEFYLQTPTTLTSDKTLKLGSSQRFTSALTLKVQNVIVDSNSPGLLDEALKIGYTITERKLDVIVERLCLQGCANYMFLAGANKTIKSGAVVGFTYGYSTTPESVLRSDLTKSGYGSNAIEEIVKTVKTNAESELALLDKLGVNRTLFDDARALVLEYEKRKNIPTVPGMNVIFWAPNRFEFACYGVKNLNPEFEALSDAQQTMLRQQGLYFVRSQDLEPRPKTSSCVGVTK